MFDRSELDEEMVVESWSKVGILRVVCEMNSLEKNPKNLDKSRFLAPPGHAGKPTEYFWK